MIMLINSNSRDKLFVNRSFFRVGYLGELINWCTMINWGMSLLLLIVTSNASAAELGILIRGESTVEGIDSGGNAFGGTSSTFSFRVQNQTWLMRLETGLVGTGSTPTNATSISDIGCDGVNIYTLVDSGGSSGTVHFDKTSIITKGVVPMFGSSGALIWLTFGAQMPHDSNTNMPAVYSSSYGPRDYLPVTVGFTSGAPRVVSRLDFLKRDAISGSVFTNATYSVLTHTNVGGVRIPTRANLLVYQRYKGTHRLIERQELIVTEVSVQPLSEPLPDMNGSDTYIIDTRFTDSSEVSLGFDYTSSRWLSKNEVMQLESFASYKNRIKGRLSATDRTSENRNLNSGLLFWFIVAVFFAPIAVFFRNRFRGKNG